MESYRNIFRKAKAMEEHEELFHEAPMGKCITYIQDIIVADLLADVRVSHHISLINKLPLRHFAYLESTTHSSIYRGNL